MRPSVKLLLACILLLAGGLRLVHLQRHLASPLGRMEEELLSTDIHAFSAWARTIAGGDLLGRQTYHPLMDWMEPIAPLETFERWWGGKAVYHQAPLYAYLLAASYALAGSPDALLILQALLGTLSVYCIFLLGRRFWDDRAGLLAALLAGLFPPAIVLDSILLRASLISSLTLLSVTALLRLKDRPGAGRALAAGLLLGMGILLKPTGLLLALAGPVVLLLAGSGPSWRRWLPALAAGIALCLAPLAGRNLALGAPALALSTRGPETTLQANNAWTDPGLFAPPPASEYAALMEKAHPSLFAALSTAIDTWPGESRAARTAWWLSHVGRKALAAYQDFEYPNNENFYFYRRTTPVLRLLPGFGWFSGAALVGVLLLALRGRDRRGALLALCGAGMILAGMLVSYAHSRYRMPLAMFLAVPAGAALAFVLDGLARRRPWPALAALCAAAALSVPAFTLVPARYAAVGPRTLARLDSQTSWLIQASQALRPLEFTRAARLLHERGESEAARKLLNEYIAELESFLETRIYTARGRPAAWGRGTVAWFLRQAGAIYARIGDAPVAAGLERAAARLEREAAEIGR